MAVIERIKGFMRDRDRQVDLLVGVFTVLALSPVADFVLDLVAARVKPEVAAWLRGSLAWIVGTLLLSLPVVPWVIGHWRELNRARPQKVRRAVPTHDGTDRTEDQDYLVLNPPDKRNLGEIGRELTRMGQRADPEVVPLLDLALSQAIVLHASDVHIEPRPLDLGIRYRIDGTLVEVAHLPRSLHGTVINRLKVMSHLPHFERSVPQDGRIFAEISGQSFDIRSSFLPTIHGEKAVLRIFESRGERFDLEYLGMSKRHRTELCDLLTRPQGIIYVTGPTGSGKTTTMYASLRHIKATSAGTVNVVTIEDPVEYALPEFSQTQVNEDVGLTFAKGLRTILRQDPDVIMVGEIRDPETAQIALQAGLTGHLMLTTVHADSTVGVFSRLVNMGIEPFLLASASVAVLSQRLVRILCPACRRETAITDWQRKLLTEAGLDVGGEAMFYTATGCDRCFGAGFKGRTMIAELLRVTDQLQEAITAKLTSGDLARVARASGMHTLLENGVSKALNGVTSLAEVLRVTR